MVQSVVDGLPGNREPDRQFAHGHTLCALQGDLSALLIGQSAAARHVKYTFLFLASFVQARRLPAQAESDIRVCTQCRKSALGADFTSSVKCIAHRAQCIVSRVFRITHHVLCRMSCAVCIASSGQWQMSDGPRIASFAPRRVQPARLSAFRGTVAFTIHWSGCGAGSSCTKG